MEDNKRKIGIFKSLKILWTFMDKKDRIIFICIFAFSLVSAITKMFFNIIPPLVLASLCGEEVKLLFIDLTSLSTISILFILLGINIVLWIIGMIHYYIIDVFARKMICVVNLKAQDLIFLERKNLDFGMTNGEISYIVKNATDCVYQLIEPLCWDILTHFLSVMINIGILFTIDWLVGVIGIAIILCILVCVFIRTKIQNPIVNSIEKNNAKIENHMLTSVQNISMITVLKSQNEEFKQLGILNKIFFKYHKQRAKLCFWYWIVIILIEYISIGLAVLAFIMRNGSEQAIASITLIFTLLADTQSTIEGWGYELGDIQVAAIKLCNIERLKPSKLNLKIAKQLKLQSLQQEHIQSLEVVNYKVALGKFKHIYHGKFESGKIYLLTGQSGCGKTTFINALCGIRESKKGDILVNDKYHVNSLAPYSDKISYMFQDSMLFDRTIEENISYPNSTLNADAKYLVKKFSIEKLLERESEGKNVRQILSGGEKKRIDFIRTLSKDADIYFFDEPTNDLDKTNVEKVIQEIKKLKTKNKICIIVSHDKRINTIVDEIVEL